MKKRKPGRGHLAAALLFILCLFAHAGEEKVRRPSQAQPRLAGADKLGISYKISRVKATGPREPLDQIAMDFEFGQITEENFLALHSAYGKRSLVPYKPERAYKLSDFLDPRIQALINYRFKGVQEKNLPWVKKNFGELGDKTVRTETNCYGTVWELLRPLMIKKMQDTHLLSLFWATNYTVLKFLQDPKVSKPISQFEVATGDIVLFVDEREDGYLTLMHAAYAIDGEIFFEKTDTGEDFLYRLVTLDDMQTKLSTLAEHKLKTIFYRPAGQPTPAAELSLSIAFDKDTAAMAKEVPAKDRPFIIVGFSPGLGGRPDPGLYRIGKTKISIDPASGRGVIAPEDPMRKLFLPAL